MANRIMAVISVILFILFLIFGINTWNAKQAETVSNAIESLKYTGETAEKEKERNKEDTQQKLNRVQLGNLVQDFPEAVIARFSEAFNGGDPVKLVLVGSSSLEYENNGWSTIVEQELETLYGKNLLDVIVYSFEGTTTEFIQSGAINEVIDLHADMMLFESLTLEDNSGLVTIDQTVSNLKDIVTTLTEANPNLYFVLQPPQPIRTTVYYPDQIARVKQFASQNQIPYLNHWEFWPDYATPEILDFLTDRSMPNEKGHELWAKAVFDFFGGRHME